MNSQMVLTMGQEALLMLLMVSAPVLGVATLVTCAVFATATGIVGAVVTLMGLLALPAMYAAWFRVRRPVPEVA